MLGRLNVSLRQITIEHWIFEPGHIREEVYMKYTTPAVTKTALSGALGEEQCWDGSIYYCVLDS